MPDASQRRSRRGFLGTLGLAAVTSAGCSSLGGTQNGQSDDTEAGGSTATPEASEMPAQTDDGTRRDENGHGHTHTDDGHDHREEHSHSEHTGHDAEGAAESELQRLKQTCGSGSSTSTRSPSKTAASG